MDFIYTMLNHFNDFIWTYIPIFALIGLGLYFTFRTKFVQFRLLPEMFRTVFDKRSYDASGTKGTSSFQAFAISAASRVGTGNMAGVATAVALGGPGALFWMWIIALIGAASGFVESTLAQLYKEKDNNQFRGGPAYYMEKGMNKRWLGITFAVMITFTYGFVFSSVQSNTISIAFDSQFNVSPVWIAVIDDSYSSSYFWRLKKYRQCFPDYCSIYGNYICRPGIDYCCIKYHCHPGYVCIDF